MKIRQSDHESNNASFLKNHNKQCQVFECDYSANAKPFELFQFSGNNDDSVQIGFKALNWLISPIDNESFFADFFGKKCFIIHRQSPNYYENFFSTSDFLKLIQENYIEYNTNINVALYKDGIRTTHNGEGRVYAHNLMEHFSNGCSIQCVNPQTFNQNIWYLDEVLQEIFCSFVGSNNYITPPNAEGFAPHWDDVDAFLVQIEGRKHWTVCAPSTVEKSLPVDSSENFADEILYQWPVVFNGWLEQGDILYIPRGFIHKANTGSDLSHHVTISVCQKFSFADLFRKTLPDLLENLVQGELILRSNLPPLLFDMSGVADSKYSGEKNYENKVYDPCAQIMRKLSESFIQFCPGSVDLMADGFMKTALPPLLTTYECKYSCAGGKDFSAKYLLSSSIKSCFSNVYVRLIRRHAQRLIYSGENEAHIVHRMSNSRIFEGRPQVSFPFPLDLEDGYLSLVNAYPNWIKDGELNLSKEGTQSLIKLLYCNCLLLIKPFDLPKAKLPTIHLKKNRKRLRCKS